MNCEGSVPEPGGVKTAVKKELGKIGRALRAFGRAITRPLPAPAAGTRMPAIGLALGGGFARGVAHIGIFKVLDEENIPLRCLAGTSVGAIMGAIYASGISVREMEKIAALVRFKDFARWTLSRNGLASNDRMIPFFDKVLKVKTFEELKLPFAVVATDFASGEPVVFRSGPLIPAIRASCAYPGIFLPVEVNGRLMVDGLLAYSVPTPPLRQMGAERVIGSHLRASWVGKNGPRHVLEIIGQCFSIAQTKMANHWQEQADVILEPDVTGFAFDDFQRAAELVRRGEQAARAALPEIRSWMTAVQPATSPRTAQAATIPVK
ncbi:MAG: patatin-like phospholipase family protein [Acidobacteria bacterium]|nr:patatin-like phospholipase family protein [Acidobacteriota bacterium]